MSRYSVELTARAEKDFGLLDKRHRKKVLERLDELAAEPRGHHTEKLEGRIDEYRCKAGHFRILFVIDDEAHLVTVARIRDRKDAY